MSVLKVVDGDLYLPLGADRFPVVGEPEATMQGLRDVLLMAVGDWFLDLTMGLDREVVTGKLTSLIPPEVEIRRVLARVVGVTQVLRVRAKRLKSRSEALALGEDATAAWDGAPGRVLYVEALVTSRTAGTLDFTLPLALAPSS